MKSKIKIELQKHIEENINVHEKLLEFSKDINELIEIIQKKLNKGGKILFCGNGGSAADAQHFSAEFLVRLRPWVNRNPIPALTLAQDTSTLTACGNDYSFDDIFLRPFQALAKKNDILFCITTSGNSKNIIKVLKTSKKLGLKSISLLGNKGGSAKGLSSLDLIVPEKNTARIQECHIFLGHFIFKSVENLLLRKKR